MALTGLDIKVFVKMPKVLATTTQPIELQARHWLWDGKALCKLAAIELVYDCGEIDVFESLVH